jgi:hypothetical protein
MNVPPVPDRGGIENKIIWHLTKIEKGLLKRGTLPAEYVGTPLPKLRVSWRQNKLGKGKSKAERDLSLNKLAAFRENGCLVCTVEAAKGSWPQLGPLWEAFHRTGLIRWALGLSCLMVIMYNGKATESDRVTMQQLRHCIVVHCFMTTHTVLPNIITIHKRVKIEMAHKSVPPHKFTELCQEFMWLTLSSTDNPIPLFDAIIPIAFGHQLGSAIVTYRSDNESAAALIKKIKCSIPAWFFGHWINVQGYRLELVCKLIESFDVDATLLACFSEFNSTTLIVTTTFGDSDEQLDSVEVNLGIDQRWEANSEVFGGPMVDMVGHREELAMTLWDRVKDVDDAVCSGPSCCSNFSHSTGNSTNNFDATTCQHTLRVKALKSIELIDRNYTLENYLVNTQDKIAAIVTQNLLLRE